MRTIRWFLGLTVLIDWGMVAVYRLLGGELRGLGGTILAVAYMFGPALAAVITQRFIAREPVRGPLGIRFRLNRWFLAGWLVPPVLALAALGVALLFPDVSFSPDMEGLYERFQTMLPPEQVEEMRRQAAALPVHPFWLALLQGLVAGATINAVAAFGEELGWRGFLQRELGGLGFWRSAGVVGVIWGVWHAPLVLHGHNYPEHPVLGTGMMVLFTLGMAPLLSYVRLRARSTLAAALMHGSVNGTFGLSILLARGGNDLTVGMTGAAGLLVLAAANAGLWLAQRAGRLAAVPGVPRDDRPRGTRRGDPRSPGHRLDSARPDADPNLV